jgi:SagB-type dehydrogenase family enzyme
VTPGAPESEALRYHERTKHSYASVRARARPLDWSRRPDPFKAYPGIEPLRLPDVPELGVPALEAIAAPPGAAAGLTLPHLARLLRLGAGVSRTRTIPGDVTYHFRTYSSAGALYPVEVYVACVELSGLAAGLYHFHPLELALRRLRSEDVRALVVEAADEPALAEAGAVLVLTGILWRSAWKYDERAYRHLFWDAGTMLANLLALAGSAGLAPRLVTGFVDAQVDEIVGADGTLEAAVAVLAVGQGPAAGASPRLEPLPPTPVPHARRYPEAEALYAASSFAGPEEVRRYRALSRKPQATSPPPPAPPSLPLETVLRRRGSERDFSSEPVPASELAAVLACAAAPIPVDVPCLTETYLIANAVDGLEPGAYRFEPPARFERLRAGSFRRQAGYLCLEQDAAARAAATVFFLADLERVVAELGDRGYRAAQLEGGIRTGRAYLGATALGLGATGLTFYDDDVSAFFGTKKAPMLCVAVGKPERRR